jgi:hypothetical protein
VHGRAWFAHRLHIICTCSVRVLHFRTCRYSTTKTAELSLERTRRNPASYSPRTQSSSRRRTPTNSQRCVVTLVFQALTQAVTALDLATGWVGVFVCQQLCLRPFRVTPPPTPTNYVCVHFGCQLIETPQGRRLQQLVS